MSHSSCVTEGTERYCMPVSYDGTLNVYRVISFSKKILQLVRDGCLPHRIKILRNMKSEERTCVKFLGQANLGYIYLGIYGWDAY